MYLAIRVFTAIMNKTWLIWAIKRNYNKTIPSCIGVQLSLSFVKKENCTQFLYKFNNFRNAKTSKTEEMGLSLLDFLWTFQRLTNEETEVETKDQVSIDHWQSLVRTRITAQVVFYLCLWPVFKFKDHCPSLSCWYFPGNSFVLFTMAAGRNPQAEKLEFRSIWLNNVSAPATLGGTEAESRPACPACSRAPGPPTGRIQEAWHGGNLAACCVLKQRPVNNDWPISF